VLNAIVAPGAALWTALTTISNRGRLFGGILRPPPITKYDGSHLEVHSALLDVILHETHIKAEPA